MTMLTFKMGSLACPPARSYLFRKHCHYCTLRCLLNTRLSFNVSNVQLSKVNKNDFLNTDTDRYIKRLLCETLHIWTSSSTLQFCFAFRSNLLRKFYLHVQCPVKTIQPNILVTTLNGTNRNCLEEVLENKGGCHLFSEIRQNCQFRCSQPENEDSFVVTKTYPEITRTSSWTCHQAFCFLRERSNKDTRSQVSWKETFFSVNDLTRDFGKMSFLILLSFCHL